MAAAMVMTGTKADVELQNCNYDVVHGAARRDSFQNLNRQIVLCRYVLVIIGINFLQVTL